MNPTPSSPSFSPSGGEGARRAVEWDFDQFIARATVWNPRDSMLNSTAVPLLKP
jgi:hypothetical protein